MIPEELEKLIIRHKSKGHLPFFVNFCLQLCFLEKRKNNTHKTFHILKMKAHFEKEPHSGNEILSISFNHMPLFTFAQGSNDSGRVGETDYLPQE